MKKNIAVLMFIGIMTWIPIGSQSQGPRNGVDQSGKVVVKGEAFDQDRDGKYESATFGLYGENYTVYSVEVLSLSKGPKINFEEVDHISFTKDGPGLTWYVVDLGKNASEIFELKVHFGRTRGFSPVHSDFFSRVFSLVAGTSPNDPDETVVILKYP